MDAPTGFAASASRKGPILAFGPLRWTKAKPQLVVRVPKRVSVRRLGWIQKVCNWQKCKELLCMVLMTYGHGRDFRVKVFTRRRPSLLNVSRWQLFSFSEPGFQAETNICTKEKELQMNTELKASVAALHKFFNISAARRNSTPKVIRE